MTTDLTFFTNEPDATLLDRFTATLRDVQFFDVLVGYFRTSGFYLLADALEGIEEIRILVGLGVDRQTLEIVEASGQQLELVFQSACQTKDLFADEVVDESMSDLFHRDVPSPFVLRVFDVMRQAHWHTFQVLTKRSERLLALDGAIDWPANVWMGVSVERQDYTFRIDHLRATHAQVKFLSLEPLLGPLPGLNLVGIGWVILGGESGPGARPLDVAWVTAVRDQCLAAGVPFFFKQWGGVRKKRAGRLLEGRTWDEMPVA